MALSRKLLIFFCLTLFSGVVYTAFASTTAHVEGAHKIRLAGTARYISKELDNIPNNSIVMIPDTRNASPSTLIFETHSIKVFPGAVFKIVGKILQPLSGRFEFNTDVASGSLSIYTERCNIGYRKGNFLIEATPDNGVFFALKNNGDVWLKDSYRKVYEMVSSQQIHIPVFGETVVKNRLEGFWYDEPAGFDDTGDAGIEIGYGIAGTGTTKSDDNKSESEKDKSEASEKELSEDSEDGDEEDVDYESEDDDENEDIDSEEDDETIDSSDEDVNDDESESKSTSSIAIYNENSEEVRPVAEENATDSTVIKESASASISLEK